MRSSKKLIVVISIVLALVVAGAIFAYLFLATDTFKSNKELFAKYMLQNTQTLQKILDLQTLEVYENLKNENKYESNTNAKMIHSEGGEVSNPLNNLTAKLDIQKNNDEQYVYVDGQILYEEQEYLEAEIIREQEIYGIRFTDAVKQFVTVKKGENTANVAKDIDIEKEQLDGFINLTNGTEGIISKDQIIDLKDKYLNIIIQELINGTFEKQKNAIITYNNATTETNAYSVSLNSNQVENVVLQILNNAKNETEILDKFQIAGYREEVVKQIDDTIKTISEEIDLPVIKVTVYENKQKTIRTVLEIGLYKIEIENSEENGEIKTKIIYSDFNSEQVMQYNSQISKKSEENQEKIEIIINALEGEKEYMINILTQMQLLNNQIEFDVEISHKQDIVTKSMVLENKINIGNDFEKTESLVLGNNILISSLQEERRQGLIKLLKEIVPQKTDERTKLLKEKLGIEDEGSETPLPEEGELENVETEGGMSKTEINKFNAKFEFYTGDEVSSSDVKKLLEIVKNNVSGHIIGNLTVGSEENAENKSNITLYIEKDNTNEESISKALEAVKDNLKYKVSVSYKEANGLIDYITISEI